jgi:hypothetical protein
MIIAVTLSVLQSLRIFLAFFNILKFWCADVGRLRVLAPNSWPDYQVLFETLESELLATTTTLSRQQYALIRKEAPSIGGG